MTDDPAWLWLSMRGSGWGAPAEGHGCRSKRLRLTHSLTYRHRLQGDPRMADGIQADTRETSQLGNTPPWEVPAGLVEALSTLSPVQASACASIGPLEAIQQQGLLARDSSTLSILHPGHPGPPAASSLIASPMERAPYVTIASGTRREATVCQWFICISASRPHGWLSLRPMDACVQPCSK
jgi:hypothetical protein